MNSVPGLGRSPGEGNDNPLQYPCVGNLMDRGTQWGTVPAVAKEQDMTKQLNNNKYIYVYMYMYMYVCVYTYICTKKLPAMRETWVGSWFGKIPWIKKYLLYPFICQWMFRLFPCLGSHKSCCYEHKGAGIFSNYSFVKNMVLY